MFAKWLNDKYGDYGEVQATHRKIQDYLGMIINFEKDEHVVIDMSEYTGKMVDDFKKKYDIDGEAATIAKEKVFGPSEGELLNDEMAADFHTYVANGLFSATRGRPDARTVVAVMTTRVRKPRENDWAMLVQYMRFMDQIRNDVLTLQADDLHVIKWYVDADFVVNLDFRSHTGCVMTMG